MGMRAGVRREEGSAVIWSVPLDLGRHKVFRLTIGCARTQRTEVASSRSPFGGLPDGRANASARARVQGQAVEYALQGEE